VDRVKLGQLPLLAKIAIAITFYNAFVLFEELAIDRRGWYRYPSLVTTINYVPGTSLQSL
jgi:hypothetical protein